MFWNRYSFPHDASTVPLGSPSALAAANCYGGGRTPFAIHEILGLANASAVLAAHGHSAADLSVTGSNSTTQAFFPQQANYARFSDPTKLGAQPSLFPFELGQMPLVGNGEYPLQGNITSLAL